jgi:replicative DNA helicase
MSDYIDISAVVQVIGAIYTNPKILDAEDKYHFVEYDFPSEFHKIVFGSIFNLHQLGVKEINLGAIADYLDQRPKKLAVYKVNKGDEYLLRCAEEYKPAAFDYYYQRLKKMTLLRGYKNAGMDVSFIYDEDNIFDAKKKQEQEDWLDNASLEDIANLVDKKIEAIRLKYVDDSYGEASQAGEGIIDLINDLKENPEVGVPLYGNLINTVTRGARLRKFYIRSVRGYHI